MEPADLIDVRGLCGACRSDRRGGVRAEDVEPADLIDAGHTKRRGACNRRSGCARKMWNVAGRARNTCNTQFCLIRAALFDSAGAASNAELVD